MAPFTAHGVATSSDLPSDGLRVHGYDGDEFETTSKTIALSDIWQGLVSGSVTVLSHHHTPRAFYVELASEGRPSGRSLSERECSLLSRMLLGTCPQILAIDSNCAASTVSGVLTRGLRQLGVHGVPSRVPLFLIVLAHAALQNRTGDESLAKVVEVGKDRTLLIMKRLPSPLEGRLSIGERDVARLLAEGATHALIAHLRETSPRTIANQVGSIYAKLKISGRLSLASALISSASAVAALETEGIDSCPST
jgi:DNA-binding CsgD family transcriptional regulator